MIYYALKNRSFSLISFVCLWNTALIVLNGHSDDSRRSLYCPGRAESRRNGCRFGCVCFGGDWTVIVIGNEGDWSRTKGGGHCWETRVWGDRFVEEFGTKNGISCNVSDALQYKRSEWFEQRSSFRSYLGLWIVDTLASGIVCICCFGLILNK